MFQRFGAGDNGSDGFTVRDLPGLGDAVEHRIEILGFGQVTEVNPRWTLRVIRRQTNPPARSGCHEADHDSERGASRDLLGIDVERACREHHQVRWTVRVSDRRVQSCVDCKSTRTL